MPPVDLANKRILVVGGSGVLGRAIAVELVNRGAIVQLAGRNPERLAAAAADIRATTEPILCDLRDPASVRSLVSTCVANLGGLDGLINAAGVVAFGSLGELDDTTLDELVATNLVGPLRLMRYAIGYLSDGFIVNITGVVAEQPMAGIAAYSAVKAGLSAAARALARELRRNNVHVLDARPPHTETGLAGRPIAGEAPVLSTGIDPRVVATTVVDAIEQGVRDLPSSAFTTA